MENKFIKRAKAVHGDKYDYSLIKYEKSKKKVKIVCPIHGVFLQTPDNHINGGKGCKECFYDSKRRTTEDFILEARKIHGNKYDYSEVNYTHNQCKVKIICPKHGPFIQFAFVHIKNNGGCPQCSKGFIKERCLTNEFISKAKSIHGSKYDYSEVNYIHNQSKVKIICPNHGIFEQLPSNHLAGSGCPKCCIENSTMSYDEFIGKAKSIYNDKYDYSDVNYVNCDTKVKIKCKTHGIFCRTPYRHLRGYGCPVCHHKVSKGQKEIYEYIGLNGVMNDRTVIKPFEIDCYYPSHRVGVEFNGVYYHSSIDDKNKYYHLNKLKMCEENSIKLIQIFENEWKYKRQIVESILDYNFGKIESKYNARECTSRLIDYETYAKFCELNHLQGGIGCKVRYGLFSNNELLCVMGFNKHDKYEWEISRLCSRIKTVVNGAVSKLFKQFINDYNPSFVMTYANRRYSNGNVYKRLGFEFDSFTNPGYFYTKNTEVYSRHKFQKHKLKSKLNNYDKNLTEFQNMVNHGFRRLWDTGNVKLVWSK